MEKEEIMELGHEPKPGYRIVYYAVIAIGIIYLTFAFFAAIIEHTENKKNDHIKIQSHEGHD
jgi:hypothetical protein